MLILVKISKLLFEPIAITAALGGVILLWQLWQAHRHYVFAVTLYGLCFMLGWRSLCGTGSSRYSAALILPGIVLSVYCIFKVSECLQKRYRLPLLITFWGLLLLLGGACILKLCRFNRYDATEIPSGQADLPVMPNVTMSHICWVNRNGCSAIAIIQAYRDGHWISVMMMHAIFRCSVAIWRLIVSCRVPTM